MKPEASAPVGVQPAPASTPAASPATRDGSSVQSVIGPNLIFTVFLPLWVATALQTTDFKLGLIIATGMSGLHCFLGVIFFILSWRRVFPYILEVTMVILWPVLMAICLASNDINDTVYRDFNFIVHSVLAGISVISMLVTYPLGVQHVQEMVPWMYSGHDDVVAAGYVTTSVFTFSFITSCLLYLIPVAKDKWQEDSNVLNIVFRIVVPMVFTFIACLFARFYPSFKLSHLQGTQVYGFTSRPNGVSYPNAVAMLARPRVIDGAMIARQNIYKQDVMDGYMRTNPLMGYQQPGMGMGMMDPTGLMVDANGMVMDPQYNSGGPKQYINGVPGQYGQNGQYGGPNDGQYGLLNEAFRQKENQYGLHGDASFGLPGFTDDQNPPPPMGAFGSPSEQDRKGGLIPAAYPGGRPQGGLAYPQASEQDPGGFFTGGPGQVPGGLRPLSMQSSGLAARQRMDPQQQISIAQQQLLQAQNQLGQVQQTLGAGPSGQYNKPGQQRYGPNGQPLAPQGQAMVQAVQQRYGPNGQVITPQGQAMGQAGQQRYGPNGQLITPQGQAMGQAGQQRYGPNGQLITPQGQTMSQAGQQRYGPNGQFTTPQGQAMGQAGQQRYGPNGQLITTQGQVMSQPGQRITSQGQLGTPQGQAVQQASGQPGGPQGQAMMNQAGQAGMNQAGQLAPFPGGQLIPGGGQAVMNQAMLNQAGQMLPAQGQAAQQQVQQANNQGQQVQQGQGVVSTGMGQGVPTLPVSGAAPPPVPGTPQKGLLGGLFGKKPAA